MKINARSEAGFSLLSVLIAVMIIGIMAAIAVPKFNSAIATANTAKIQSDLTNIDSAIAMYKMDTGENPKEGTLKSLSGYLTDVDNIKPPKGDCYLKDGTTITLTAADEYQLKVEDGEYRATCKDKVASAFGKPSGSSSGIVDNGNG